MRVRKMFQFTCTYFRLLSKIMYNEVSIYTLDRSRLQALLYY